MKLSTAVRYGLGTAILSSQDGFRVDAGSVSVMPFKNYCVCVGIINTTVHHHHHHSPLHEMLMLNSFAYMSLYSHNNYTITKSNTVVECDGGWFHSSVHRRL